MNNIREQNEISGGGNSICSICGSEMKATQAVWHFVCHKCSYEYAELSVMINNEGVHEAVDEIGREEGLKALRLKNFETLIDELKSLAPNGATLLEVGCAHGWFLEKAKPFYKCTGIEPDSKVFQNLNKKSLDVKEGFFPDVLSETDKFDIIVFNDVIEHIPDINKTIENCKKHLNAGGLLLLNIPNSRGVFYRVSKLFNSLGVDSFFKRMWQYGLPSPHLHYFCENNISRLINNHSLEIEKLGRLPSIQVKGLYTRIAHVENGSKLKAVLIYLAVALFSPIVRVFESDIMYVIAKK